MIVYLSNSFLLILKQMKMAIASTATAIVKKIIPRSSSVISLARKEALSLPLCVTTSVDLGSEVVFISFLQ